MTEQLRSRFWVWAHEAGAYNETLPLPRKSRITPVEGAYYMGIPNVISVSYNGKPVPPFEQYALPFKSLEKVYWWLTGAGGKTSDTQLDEVLKLAAEMPNITGVIMDDFFIGLPLKESSQDAPFTALTQEESADTPSELSVLSVEQLDLIREKLNNVNGRRLDLAVALYTFQLVPKIKSHIERCDVVSLWTWNSDDLKDLEKNMQKFKQIAPGKRILLGCYLWDAFQKKAIPLELMKKQCELGLKWLKDGEIEGMIFLGTNLCDVNLEAAEWVREWIAEVGDGHF